MWEFDEAVDVRSNVVDGAPVPDQFLWRGRLWKVCSIRARWVETAVWWERGVIGAGVGTSTGARLHSSTDAPVHVARPDAWYTATGRDAAPLPVGAEAPSTGQGPACSGEARGSRFRPAVAACTFGPEPGHRAPAPATMSAAPGAGAPGGGVSSAGVLGAGASESPAAVGVLDADWGPNRTVYRVEAGFGRDSRRELFDLAHDPDSGRWQLERVMDR